MGTEIYVTVPHFNNARDTEHSSAVFGKRLGHTCPCYDNTAAVFVSSALRGIKILAAVKKLPFVRNIHFAACFVKIGKGAYRNSIIKLFVFQKAKRGYNDNSRSVSLKIIGTFPHPAHAVLFGKVHVFPVNKIGAFVEKQTSFSVSGAAQNHVPCVLATPYLGVTGMIFAAYSFILNRRYYSELVRQIIKIIAVFRGYGHLCGSKFIIDAGVDVLRIFLFVAHTSVENVQPAVMLNSASRKAAASVIGL